MGTSEADVVRRHGTGSKMSEEEKEATLLAYAASDERYANAILLPPTLRIFADEAKLTLDLAYREGGLGCRIRFKSLPVLQRWESAILAEGRRSPLQKRLVDYPGMSDAIHAAAWGLLMREVVKEQRVVGALSGFGGAYLALLNDNDVHYNYSETDKPLTNARVAKADGARGSLGEVICALHDTFSIIVGSGCGDVEARGTSFASLLKVCSTAPSFAAIFLALDFPPNFLESWAVGGLPRSGLAAFDALVGTLEKRSTGVWAQDVGKLFIEQVNYPDTVPFGDPELFTWLIGVRRAGRPLVRPETFGHLAGISELGGTLGGNDLQMGRVACLAIFFEHRLQKGDAEGVVKLISSCHSPSILAKLVWYSSPATALTSSGASNSNSASSSVPNPTSTMSSSSLPLGIVALIHKGMQGREAFASIIAAFISGGVIDDAFFKAFLDAALPIGITAYIVNFMDAVFFPPNASQGSAFEERCFLNVPNFLPIIMNSVAAAIKAAPALLHYKKDQSLATILEYSLRLEFELAKSNDKVSTALAKVVSLKRWFHMDEDNIDTVTSNMDKTDFFPHIATIIGTNRAVMKTASNATSSSSSSSGKRAPASAAVSSGGEGRFNRVKNGSKVHVPTSAFNQSNLENPSFSPPVLPTLNYTPSYAAGVQDDIVLRRRREYLYGTIFGLFEAAVFSESDVVFALLQDFSKTIGRFFTYYLGVEEGQRRALRDAMVPFLLDEGVSVLFKAPLMNGELFSCNKHLGREVITALKAHPSHFSPELFVLLTRTAIKLEDWDDLTTRLVAIEEANRLREDRKVQLLAMATAMVDRGDVDDSDISGVTLDTLDECARLICDARNVLSGMADAQARLQGMLTYYIKSKAPKTWKGLFDSAKTVAIFLKYLEREDLPKAYDKFKEVNEPGMNKVLELMVRPDYNVPLVTSDQLAFTGSMDDIEQVMAAIEASSQVCPQGKEHIQLLQRMYVGYMRKMILNMNVPMIPRNCQVITYLTAAAWMRDTVSKGVSSAPKSFIGQVGTGEGKSLIIAMTALYACCLGHKVHVLESNEGLRDRDFADLEDYYKKFGLKVSASYSDDSNICYLTRREIEAAYRERLFAGNSPPFGKTVVIVDEVDDLIVDAKPTMGYVKADSGFGPSFADALRAHASGQGRPGTVSSTIWACAKEAYDDSARIEAAGQNKPNGWAEVSDGSSRKAVGVDARGCYMLHSYSEALEALNFRRYGKAPSYKSVFMVQSVPHMFSQYAFILGYSGSLGSPSERDFLRKTYDATFLTVPPFLDTCKDAQKHKPRLLDDKVIVFDSFAAEAAGAVALAEKHRKDVPVIIITDSPDKAKHVFGLVRNKSGPQCTQLLLQYDDSGVPMNTGAIVGKATEKVNGMFHITVTDLYGGRGQDYRSFDEDVDSKGGVLLILLDIPQSEREFIQWKGRTARSDCKGQYYLLLSKESAPILGNESKLAAHAIPGGSATDYKEFLISVLLDIRDEDTKKAIADRSNEIRSGQIMNELCDKFYKRHGSSSGVWPSGPEQIKLRDFLTYWSNNSLDEVARFAVTVGLASSPEDYKGKSIYGNP